MKQYIALTVLINLAFSLAYLWGADHNRYICAVLWFVFPMMNLILFGLFEKQINKEF